MKRELTCIICPRGCQLQVTGEKEHLQVQGHTCPKGEQYAIEECTCPVRTVTSTVRVANRPGTMVSVKTARPVPKEKLLETMQIIRTLQARAPVTVGDVLKTGVFGTEILATDTVL